MCSVGACSGCHYTIIDGHYLPNQSRQRGKFHSFSDDILANRSSLSFSLSLSYSQLFIDFYFVFTLTHRNSFYIASSTPFPVDDCSLQQQWQLFMAKFTRFARFLWNFLPLLLLIYSLVVFVALLCLFLIYWLLLLYGAVCGSLSFWAITARNHRHTHIYYA